MSLKFHIFKNHFFFFAVLFFFLSSLSLYSQENASEKTRRILFVDSYSASDCWTSCLQVGIQDKLSEKKIKINYDSFSFAVRSQPGIVPSRADIDALQLKLDKKPYDLVILSNNPAVDLFLTGALHLPPETPILVSSYHNGLKIPEELNMTAVETPVNLLDNIRLGMNLLPETEKFVLIAEASDDDRAQEDFILQSLPENIAEKITLISGDEYTTDEMMEIVSKLLENSIIIFHSWGSSKEDIPEDAYSVLERIREIFPGLILGKYKCYIGMGAAGGVVPCANEEGLQAGELAYRILSGESPRSIPPQMTETKTILDYSSLQAADVRKSAIPENAVLVNIPPGFIEEHLNFFIFGTILLIGILLFFIFNMNYRGRTKKKIFTMFENLPVRVLIFNRNREILYTHLPDDQDNMPFVRGKKMDDLELLHKQIFIDSIAKVFATGEKVETDYKIAGQLRHVKLVLLPKDTFGEDAVMTISGNITELYRAHLIIAEMAERFRLTLEAIGDGVIATDNEGRITLINRVAAKLTGYTQEEAVEKPVQDIFKIVSYIDNKPVNSPLHQALRENRIVELPNHAVLIAKDGTRRHIADSAAPILDKNSKVTGAVLVFRDVTAEYNSRDQLQMNGIVLKHAAKIGKFNYFRCSSEGKYISFAISDYNFWPSRNGEPLPPEEWVSPQDLSEFTTAWENLISGKTDMLSIVYSAESKEIENKGKIKYFEMRAEKIVNEINGKREFCGVIQDITHIQESAIRYRDNLNLLETIITYLPGYIFVKDCDDDFRYIMCNNKFEEIIGLPQKKIINSFDRDIFSSSPEFAKRLADDDKKILLSGKPSDTSLVFRNIQGKDLAVRVVKNVVKQPGGSHLMLGMGLDITREYQLECAQKENIELLNNYINSERIINQSLRKITLENDLGTAVNEMLRIIGENVGADRSYVFRYTDENFTRSKNMYEWVRDGIKPQIDNLQDTDMQRHPEWQRRLLAKKDIIIEDINNPPEELAAEAEFLSQRNTKSVLATGIWIDGKLYGFVGLDFINTSKVFTKCDIDTVHSIVRLFLLARERQFQLNQLADSVALQRQVVDNISIPIAIMDLDYNVVAANPAAAKEVGSINADRMLGTKCYDSICGYGKPSECCPMKKAIETAQPFSVERKVNGRMEIITMQPIFDRQGKLIHILRSAIDITEFTRQKRELQKAMELALAADKAKTYFLASVSHELRTPLNAVIGFSELLQNGDVPQETQLEYLHSINFAGNALLNLINDVLDLSRLEADQMNMTPTETDVASLIRDAVSVFTMKAQSKGLDLKINRINIPYLLLIDNLRLRQVILNLLGNAVKFTSDGYVTIDAEFVPSNQESGDLAIHVSDTGIGISPEFAEKIFDPFMQEGVTRGYHVYEGSGLGLTISQKLIKKMGGEIVLSSVLGKGSIFSVRLKNIPYITDVKPPVPAENTSEKPEQRERPRLLLVDDVPMNLKVLTAMLKALNYDAVSADSGKKALEILKKDKNFDAILTDLWMPEMSGVILARKIHNDPSVSQIPVFVITADMEAVKKTTNAFKGAILKPVTSESLKETIQKVLGANPK